MFDFSSFWLGYLEYCQRSWLEAARWWMPVSAFSGARDDDLPLGLLETFSPDAWLSILTPWAPRVEANIEPFAADAAAGLAKAARVSMRVFMPWGGEPFWVEALVGQHGPKAFAGQEAPFHIAEGAVHDVIPHDPAQDA
jgi:hypothetical protein